MAELLEGRRRRRSHAASNGSLGRARRPATKIRTMNGVHCQMSASISPASAVLGLPRIGLAGSMTPSRTSVVVENAELPVLHQQKHHARDRGRNHERECHQRAHHAVAAPVAVEQERQPHPDDELDRERQCRVGEGHGQRVPHPLVGERRVPLLEPDELELAGDATALLEAEPDAVQQWIDAAGQDQRGHRQQPGQRMLGGQPSREAKAPPRRSASARCLHAGEQYRRASLPDALRRLNICRIARQTFKAGRADVK